MAVYLVNILLLPLYGRILKNSKKLSVLIIAVQLFLLLAFRNENLGVDVGNYKTCFNAWKELSFSEIISGIRFLSNAKIVYGLESGYVLLNWIVAKIGLNFKALTVIHAIICTSSFAYFVYRYSKNTWLSFSIIIAFGIYDYTFCILRQSLAVAILLFALPCVMKRKPFKFLLLCLLAGWIHRVAFLFLFVYPLSKIKIDGKVILANVILWCLFVITIPALFRFIIAPLFAFTGKSYTITFEMNKMIILVLLIFFGMILLLSKAKCLRSFFDDRTNSALMWMFIIGIYIEILSLFLPVFSRAAIEMFFIAIACLLPNVICSTQNKQNTLVINTITFVACFALYVIVLLGNALSIVPYVLIKSKI